MVIIRSNGALMADPSVCPNTPRQAGESWRATAPVRICDVGGWTDTWFAGRGVVSNIAVGPGATVVVTRLPESECGSWLLVKQQNSNENQRIRIGDLSAAAHPLLHAAIVGADPGFPALIEVGAQVPAGAGMGTSASVTVALLAALYAAKSDVRAGDPAALARDAHLTEIGLGWQSGVQDQLAAAFGGIGHIVVDYPHAVHSPVVVDSQTLAEIDRRLLTVYLGSPHNSSALHDDVIRRLEGTDSQAMLRPLRELAQQATQSLQAGDLRAYGLILDQNTEAQARLDPRLVTEHARRLRVIGQAFGVLGMKVNGAGGTGGSVSFLGPDDPRDRIRLIAALEAEPGCAVLDVGLATTGVTVRTVSGDQP